MFCFNVLVARYASKKNLQKRKCKGTWTNFWMVLGILVGLWLFLVTLELLGHLIKNRSSDWKPSLAELIFSPDIYGILKSSVRPLESFRRQKRLFTCLSTFEHDYISRSIVLADLWQPWSQNLAFTFFCISLFFHPFNFGDA